MEFTQLAKEALQIAGKEARSLGQSYVGTEHILLGLVKQKTGMAAKTLLQNGINEYKLCELIREMIAPPVGVVIRERDGYTPRATGILNKAEEFAEKFRATEIGTEHILLALILDKECSAVRLMQSLGVKPVTIYNDIMLAMGVDRNELKQEIEARNHADTMKILNQYSRDLTALAEAGKLDPVIGREDEITRVIQILSRRVKNNPCLLGEPGVGKTAIIEGLAQRIHLGDVPQNMLGKRVMTLDLSGLVAGSKYRGEFEERMKKLMKEVIANGNIILFLDEIHTIIGAGGAEGAIDAANILKPSLARGEIQLIGATTIEEYRKHMEKDAALVRRFQTVMVEEPTILEAIQIVSGIKHKYEEHHNVTISDQAVETAVKLSARYINDRNLPDKAIDLIDEAAASIKLSGLSIPPKCDELLEQIDKLAVQIERSIKFETFSQAHELRLEQEKLQKKYNTIMKKYEKKMTDRSMVVTEEEIAAVVSRWAKIPLKKLEEKESERLLKLEDILHKRVIGQSDAVTAVSRAIRRGRVGLADPNKPIGSFLFLGPTGVGKTELSKALAEVMFGNENELIRVDMSEYMEQHSVAKMIGSPPGYVGHDEGGQLSEKVRRHPYSVVLFDEIEKAHPDVFNVLLQVLDDGHITDSKGRKVSFKNTIIIMTSNAGASRIVDPKNLGFASKTTAEQDYKKMKDGVMEEVKRLFKPEFINRIDEIMVFRPLNEKELKQIVTLLFAGLVKRCKEQMGIHLTVSPALKEYLVKKYCDVKMGARPLKRAIQSAVEDPMAEEILAGKIKAGDQVTATVAKEQVVFKVKERKNNDGNS